MIERLHTYRNYIYTMMLLILLLSLGLYFMLLKPNLHQLEEMQHQYKVETEEVKSLHSQLEDLQNTDTTNSIELQKSLPVTPSVEQIILDIEQMEKQARVNINTITFDIKTKGEEEEISSFAEDLLKLVNGDTVKEMDKEREWLEKIQLTAVKFNIQLTGSYLNLMQLLKLIDDLPRTVHIDLIQFQNQHSDFMLTEETNKETNKEINEEISGTISLTAYYADQFAPFVNDTPEIIVNQAVERDNPLYYKK
jgi:Tfp pilus assembly protein PilO